jgi:hypothetical protein
MAATGINRRKIAGMLMQKKMAASYREAGLTGGLTRKLIVLSDMAFRIVKPQAV